MLRAIAFASAMLIAGSAMAASSKQGGNCLVLSKLKADASVKVSTLTPGQWNWLRGFFAGSPPALQGALPGTGAIILQRPGDKGGMLMWTRGVLACAPQHVPPPFIDALNNTKTGPTDADGTEI